MPVDANDEIRAAIHEHLARWGLKRFTSDNEYFAWQRQQLSPADLNQLNRQIERKRGGDHRDEIAFYDLAAQPAILPILHSQHYDYYEVVGMRAASCFGEATRILDFGCGVGILTTLYARRFPGREFLGVDRSPAAIAAARQKANELGLTNVTFDCVDVETGPLSGACDLIVATHALVQAEQDPGIPSESWQTFGRSRDAARQADFERRTGIGLRLDRVSAVLGPHGRMVVCEKVRQLARRVPFQRALAERGLQLVEQPEPIRYRLIEETVDDGPFFLLQRGSGAILSWDEAPEQDEGRMFDRKAGRTVPIAPDTPIYENHWPSAQAAWEQLKNRKVKRETTRQESGGRQLHVELGTSEGLIYLYCANTFDRRQLVIAEPARAAMLDAYYQEILDGIP